jgi:20S proteasome subunit alpha 7
MSSTGAGYDYSPTVFSPEGRIYQVEYAMKAVEGSGTAVGVHCTDGVVVALEKVLISPLLIPGSNRRVFTIDEHLGLAVSGFGADGRKLANEARHAASEYRRNFASPSTVKSLAERLGGLMHAYTCYGALRPFGCAFILAGYDEDLKKPSLYMSGPDGVCLKYYGCAIGKGVQAAKTEIESKKLTERTCKDSLKDLAKILHLNHDADRDQDFELEMGWLCEQSGWKFQRVPKDLMDAANAEAKAEVETSDEDDSDEDSDSDED